MNIVRIAEFAHNINRVYCQSLGDDSQVPWSDAPRWQKESAINGVEFHLKNDKTPEESHENWLAEKENDGWVYGDVKDAFKKTHPCMLPYSELPIDQRFKDHLFREVIENCKNFS